MLGRGAREEMPAHVAYGDGDGEGGRVDGGCGRKKEKGGRAYLIKRSREKPLSLCKKQHTFRHFETPVVGPPSLVSAARPYHEIDMYKCVTGYS